MIQKSFWKEEKATIIIFSHVQVEQRDYNQRNIKRMKIIEIELRFHQMLNIVNKRSLQYNT